MSFKRGDWVRVKEGSPEYFSSSSSRHGQSLIPLRTMFNGTLLVLEAYPDKCRVSNKSGSLDSISTQYLEPIPPEPVAPVPADTTLDDEYRDRVAIAALQGFISTGYSINLPTDKTLAARSAYEYADVMLAERSYRRVRS